MTWCFRFECEEVEDSPLSLTVEWLPVPGRSWREVAGQHLTCAEFAAPAEASVYHFVHHRFERIDLRLGELRGRSLQAAVTLIGDVDRFGQEAVRAEGRLDFDGILVALPGATSPDEALTELNRHTDTRDLVFDPDSGDAALRFK